MYPNALWFASYSRDFVEKNFLLFFVVSVMFLTKKAKHTFIFLKDEPPCSSFFVICLWSAQC